jgi:hypothetical protein
MNREQPGLNIDINQTTEITCENCGNNTFIQVAMVRKLSALLSPTGQPTMIPIQAFACLKCNHINKDFIPPDLEENNKED